MQCKIWAIEKVKYFTRVYREVGCIFLLKGIEQKRIIRNSAESCPPIRFKLILNPFAGETKPKQFSPSLEWVVHRRLGVNFFLLYHSSSAG